MESLANKEVVEELVLELKRELRTREVKFSYYKKDGSVREARGTLKSEIYGKENEPSSNGREFPDNQIRYYDLDSNGWRSFLAENLINFE